jgi:hypothetical protein
VASTIQISNSTNTTSLLRAHIKLKAFENKLSKKIQFNLKKFLEKIAKLKEIKRELKQ